MNFLSAFAASLLATICASCATRPIDDRRDPYEAFNRQMFAFNNELDRAILEPVARGYRRITNEPVRTGVSNFVGNLGEPIAATNETLQGRVGDAAQTTGRFLLNSTIGLAGVFDPATSMGLQRADEDFGQTLGVWGAASGPYLVVPVIGPASPRDLVGMVVDLAANPLNLVSFDGAGGARASAAGIGVVADREAALESVAELRAAQLDPYTTVRRLHVLGRAGKVGTQERSPSRVEGVAPEELDF